MLERIAALVAGLLLAAHPVAGTTATVHRDFPVLGPTDYGRAHHDYPATDIFAACGRRVVSPVDGVVLELRRRDRWSPTTDRGADRGGKFVSIRGRDGVRYYLSHLSGIRTAVHAGMRVRAGQHLAWVGHTGSARFTSLPRALRAEPGLPGHRPVVDPPGRGPPLPVPAQLGARRQPVAGRGGGGLATRARLRLSHRFCRNLVCSVPWPVRGPAVHTCARGGAPPGPTSATTGVHARACHPRQDPPHRRGQDPPAAGGHLQGGQRDRGRLRRDVRRGAPGADRRVPQAPRGRRVARRPDARGVRHRARGLQAGHRHAPVRRPDHGRRRAAPRQHRRDEDR